MRNPLLLTVIAGLALTMPRVAQAQSYTPCGDRVVASNFTGRPSGSG